MTWNVPNSNMIPKAEAIQKITEKAYAEGIRNSFKVFYEDRQIVTENDLPEFVDMSKVRVSQTLNNA